MGSDPSLLSSWLRRQLHKLRNDCQRKYSDHGLPIEQKLSLLPQRLPIPFRVNLFMTYLHYERLMGWTGGRILVTSAIYLRTNEDTVDRLTLIRESCSKQAEETSISFNRKAKLTRELCDCTNLQCCVEAYILADLNYRSTTSISSDVCHAEQNVFNIASKKFGRTIVLMKRRLENNQSIKWKYGGYHSLLWVASGSMYNGKHDVSGGIVAVGLKSAPLSYISWADHRLFYIPILCRHWPKRSVTHGVGSSSNLLQSVYKRGRIISRQYLFSMAMRELVKCCNWNCATIDVLVALNLVAPHICEAKERVKTCQHNTNGIVFPIFGDVLANARLHFCSYGTKVFQKKQRQV